MKKTWWLLLTVLLVALCAVIGANAEIDRWVKEGTHLCYYKNGAKVTGVQTINNDIYYFTDEGYLKHNGQIQNAKYYGLVYLNDDNELITGWNTIQEDTYYFFPDSGKAAVYNYDTYSVEIDGERYAFDNNGKLMINRWYSSIYGGDDGKALLGYHTIGTHNYLFSETGKLQTGFHEINGQLHYFFNESGSFYCYEALGWVEDSKKLYYFDPQTGIMQTTSRIIDGVNYTFNSNGILQHSEEIVLKLANGIVRGYDQDNNSFSGWKTINGETYFFSNTGDAYLNIHQMAEGDFYFDTMGRMQKNSIILTTIGMREGLYYFGLNGNRESGWKTVNGDKYYFGYSGAYIGRNYIDDNYYFFADNGVMQANCFIENVQGSLYPYYYASDGKEAFGWTQLDNETYYFGPWKYVDVHEIDENYYYFDEEGKLQKNVLAETRESENSNRKHLYYYNADGQRVEGWLTLGEYTYYFNNWGLYTGAMNLNDEYYFFDEEGRLQTNRFIQMKWSSYDEKDSLFYYGADGKRVSGWLTISGYTYYFNPAACTDVWQIGQDYYYFDDNGRMQKNILKKTKCYQGDSENHLYYYGADGKRVIGWQTINGSKYYFSNYDGAYTGERQIDDANYYFDDNGILQLNTWITRKENGYEYYYYYDVNGKAASGWTTINNDTYYFNPEACVDVCYIDGDYYYFDEKGRMKKNLLKKTKVYEGDNAEGLFYYGNDGKRVYGWYELNGDKYYFDYNGAKTGKTKLDSWDIWTGNDYIFSDEGKLIDTIIYATDISLPNNQSVTVVEGETVQVVPIIYPANATSRKVKWESYDASIAQVDAEGRITGVSEGNATILVSLESNSHWVQCFVRVLRKYSIEGFVYRCYRTILGRDPDDEGLNTWVNELYSGRKAAAEIIEQFVDSAEFQNKKLDNGQVVEILYKTMMGRGSDPTGKADWVGKLDAGQHVTAVINGFCGSAEFGDICNSYGINPGTVEVQDNPSPPADNEKIKAYVERCYQIILGRGADEGGLNTWMDELTSGRKAAAEIIEQFVASAEFQNKKLSNSDSVEILYKAMLGRGSDPAGKASWVEKLDEGQDLTAVINGFCGSAEFKAICDSYGIQPGTVTVKQPTVPAANDEKIQAFVARCYKIILGRDADEGGMNTWFNELKSGRKAAAEIIESFVNSQEFKNKNYSNADAVEILYKAMLGRGSDPAGKADWVEKLNAGQPLEAVINGFCGSAEFKAICDAYGITPGTVNVPQLSKMAVMEEVPAEKPVVKETVNNVTRVEITNTSDTVNEQLGTAVQAIYINEEKAKEFIGRCYRVILGREASQAELESWIGQMTNGSKTADQIARGFLFSGEFKGRNISNEDLVKILYRVYMNREADAEGLATWTQKLDEGTSLNDLLDIFSKTNEFKAVVRNMAQ